MQFFGDSYDVVKRFLLRSVAPHAEWAAFPMFSHEVTATDISLFEAFLGVRVVSPAALTLSTNREDYFAAMVRHRHVFLDPDTGIKLNPSTRADSIKYVFGPEIETLCRESTQQPAARF